MKLEAQALNRTQIQSQISHHSPSSSVYLFIASNWWSIKCGLFPVIHPSLPYCDQVIMLEEKQRGSFIFFFKNSPLGYKKYFLPVLPEMTELTEVSNHIFASRLPIVSNSQSIQKRFNYWTYFKFLLSNPVTFMDFRGNENIWQAEG